ncbi:MAG: lipopolysaccharide biosynthesis protein [Hyphomonadaceae bacterium]|jgi:PST family polysaccharide transporter|nr:lipopolysaccharide biosynthesis protein [Hyphomonadaceae bacterium]
MENLKERAVRGGLAKLIGQGVGVLLRVSTLAVLARLLSPSDFGIAAMVIIVAGFFELLASAGLQWAAIQAPTITDQQRSKLFWFNLSLGAAFGFMFVAAAPLLAQFYGEPRLFWVAPAYALSFLLTSAGVQHLALLERQLRYVVVTYIDLGAQIVYAASAILLAVAGVGYWALVFASLLQAATLTSSAWLATRWVPGLPRRDTEIGSLLRFGATLTLNNLVVWLAYNTEKILLGRYWGADALGIYGRAYQLINFPVASINAATGGVAISSLSRLHDDPVRHRAYFLKGYSLLLSLSMPLTAFCAVFGDDIVLVFLGSQWTEAVPVFRLLTPTVLFFGMINPLQALLLSLGLQRRSLYLAMVIAPLVIGAVALGIPYGPTGVAFAFSAATSLWLVPHILWCLHGTNISPRDMAVAAGKPFLAAVVAGVAGFAAHYYLGGLGQPLLRLCLGGIVTFGVYFGMLLFALGQRTVYLDLLQGFRAAGRAGGS